MSNYKKPTIKFNYVRPNELEGYTRRFTMSCGVIYVTFNFDQGKLREIFFRIGKTGGCPGTMAEGLGKALSLALQNGTTPSKLGKSLYKMQCVGAQMGSLADPKRLLSCLDGIGRELLEIGVNQDDGKVYHNGWNSAYDKEDVEKTG